jgi:tRNA G10  N-methylase Trm11
LTAFCLTKNLANLDDEKHVHPLQLDVIERIVTLRSNPDEIVLTPFMGVGSEVYGALINGRRAIGIELKSSYFKQAKVNVREADSFEVEDCAMQELSPFKISLKDSGATRKFQLLSELSQSAVKTMFERHKRACEVVGCQMDPYYLADAVIEAKRLERKRSAAKV